MGRGTERLVHKGTLQCRVNASWRCRLSLALHLSLRGLSLCSEHRVFLFGAALIPAHHSSLLAHQVLPGLIGDGGISPGHISF